MAKTAKLPAWYGDVEAAGAAKAGMGAATVRAVDSIKAAGGLPAPGSERDAAVSMIDAAYLTGYLSKQGHDFASAVRMDKATFKALAGDAKDATTEKGRVAVCRKMAADAVYQFRRDVLKYFSTPVENSGEAGEGETAEAAAKSEADLMAAFRKKFDSLEKQMKSEYQKLRDAGIKVKAEALVTKAFDAIRTPDELTTREG
jgi:hypothetical protein